MAGIFRFKRINWNAALLCFLAASVFWFFSELNQEHLSALDVPVTIVTDYSKFVETSGKPYRVRIQVEGKGWEMLSKQLWKRIDPLTLDVSDPVAQPIILTQPLAQSIREVLEGLRIVHIQSDSIQIFYQLKKSESLDIILGDSVKTFR